jgi:hypothetical protein
MKRILMLAALASGAGTGAAHAQLAVGAGIGTGGISAEAQYEVTPWLQLRGGYNFFELDADDEEYDGVSYDGTLDLASFGGFLDLHPFSNSFVVSIGAIGFSSDQFLDASATPTQNVEIGDQTFTPAQIGTLGLTASFEESVAPYLGVGWDSTLQGDNKGIGVKLLLGAVFAGSPRIDMTSTGGSLSGNATFQQELAEEEQNVQQDLDEYEILPHLQFGLTFAF